MWPFTRSPVVPVVRLHGTIGAATPLRPGLTIGGVAAALDKAFHMSRTPSVAIVVNSPGGSPVQSNLILKRVRQLAEEKKKKVYVFCEDIAASGGYFIALAGDEIHADPSSIVGSIGVITATFGFDRAMEKLGVERRIYTAGRSKSILDPFQPEKLEDVERLMGMQQEVHDVFIETVKSRRAGRLKGPETELFSGAFWAGAKALDYGLIDGLVDLKTRMRELHGPKVKLKVVPLERGGLFGWLRRLPGVDMPGDAASEAHRLALADDLVSAVDARALWARYGF